MDTKELMRGNILYYEGNLVRVEQVFKDGCSISYSDDSVYMEYVSASNLFPVKLTDDTLLNIGFEKKIGSKGEYFRHTGILGFRMWLSDENIDELYNIGRHDYNSDLCTWVGSSKSLHKLQNIFDLLTGSHLIIKL